MIIYTSKHLRVWGGLSALLIIVAVAVRVYFQPVGNEPLPGGRPVGLTFGVLGGAIIVFAWLLALLRFVPSWWFIGSRAAWLKGHIWLGLVSFILILCHSGLRFGGPFEQLLYLVFFLVVVTGVFGLILQQFLPRWLTVEVPCEVPYEQIPNVCATLREKADVQMARPRSQAERGNEAAPPATCERIERWYSEVVRPFLGWPARNRLLTDASKTAEVFAQVRALPGVEQAKSLLDLLDRLEEYCNDRRRLARQESLHRILHGWLYLHVPLSFALLVMMIVHAVITLYY